jgi:hypothetical protein
LDDGQSEPAAPTTGIAPPIWMDDDWIEIIFSIGFQPQLTTSTEVSLVVLSLSLSLSLPYTRQKQQKKGKQTNFLEKCRRNLILITSAVADLCSRSESEASMINYIQLA